MESQESVGEMKIILQQHISNSILHSSIPLSAVVSESVGKTGGEPELTRICRALSFNL
jgi:hypothetical protein